MTMITYTSAPNSPRNKEIHNAFQVPTRAVHCGANNFKDFNLHYQYEKLVQVMLGNNTATQSAITNVFK